LTEGGGDVSSLTLLDNHQLTVCVISWLCRRSSKDNLSHLDASISQKKLTGFSELDGCNSAPTRSDFKSNFESTQDFEDRNSMQRFVPDHARCKWNVGRISVVMLILFTLMDVILSAVDIQMHSIESPDYYDALSAEVIRPPFHYHSSNADRSPTKPRLGLGSAAISSITEVLSPILPFTGGLDLRKEDYWTNGWFGSATSVVQQVRDAFSTRESEETEPAFLKTPRGGGNMPASFCKSKKTSASKHMSALSDSKPFVRVEDIAEMTLKDVTVAFRYAIQSTREDFNQPKFMKGVLPRVKNVVEKMSEAVSKSRGKDVKPALTGGLIATPESGDMDALHFCAVMRIFAEWRVLRVVPEGYKGYAVGISLGHKDIVQNVAKIEQAVHAWIDHRRELLSIQEGFEEDSAYINAAPYAELRSPTLRDLLQFEIDIEVHDKLPRLREKTAAMGLVWVRRQLQYQTALFENVLHVPTRFESTKDAVSAAYLEVYNKYHGWAVQKIFSYSFQAAPEATEIYKFMNPYRMKEVTESAQTQGVNSLDIQVSREEFTIEEGNPFEKVGRHIGREWDKLAGPVIQIFGGEPSLMKLERVRGGSQEEVQQADIDEYITREMTKDAHAHILAHLEVVKPLLKDLAELFDELNMDDPTKV
jgi:hypothetical protein